MELPIKVELISKHYKCFVITVILWKHMARAESIDLPWTFIQPWFSKPAVYLSRTLAYMATRLRLERRRSSSLHGSFQDYCLTIRLTGLIFSIISYRIIHTASFVFKHLVGSRTLRVYCPFKTNTFIFIKLTFCPLSTWKTVGTEPLGNQVPMAEIIWLLIAHQTDITFSDIKTVCHSRQI